MSGGAYGSPQVLMLSGIGPADHLREVGIDVVHDLPGVGQNLSEHPVAYTSFKAKSSDTFVKFLRLDRATLNVLRWYLFGSGPFAGNGAYANIFMRTDPRLDRPDVQIICAALGFDAELWFPGATAPPIHRYTVSPAVLHPQSRGWVKLRSSNPDDPPRILFNMLSERADMDTMIAGFKASREVFAQAPMKDLVDGQPLAGRIGQDRRADRGVPARRHRADASPGRHLHHGRRTGSRRRRRVARARHRRLARRRRLGDAG